MFSESLVESSPLIRSHNRIPALISIGVQLTLALTVILVPMLHPEILPTAGTKLATLAPPPTPVPPPPQIRPRIVTTSATSAPTAPATAPSHATELIRSILNLTGPAVETPVYAATNMGPSNPALPAGLAPAAPTVSVAAKPGPATLTRVSSGVIAGLLMAPIRTDYPRIAKFSRTEGTVVIQAIISKDGHIESAHVLSGPAMLQGAALDAVKVARYHPYQLNGEPTEVETTISIIFHLSS